MSTPTITANQAAPTAPRPHVLEAFRSAAGWSWRFLASNGLELGRSSQVYSRRIDALNSGAIEHGLHPDAMTDGTVTNRLPGVPVQVLILDERVQS